MTVQHAGTCPLAPDGTTTDADDDGDQAGRCLQDLAEALTAAGAS